MVVSLYSDSGTDMKLIVKTRFEVTTTLNGKLFAEVGDVIKVSNRDGEYYNILRVNQTPVFSRWMRKNWVNAKCEGLAAEKEGIF